jgi:hypothetical protein
MTFCDRPRRRHDQTSYGAIPTPTHSHTPLTAPGCCASGSLLARGSGPGRSSADVRVFSAGASSALQTRRGPRARRAAQTRTLAGRVGGPARAHRSSLWPLPPGPRFFFGADTRRLGARAGAGRSFRLSLVWSESRRAPGPAVAGTPRGRGSPWPCGGRGFKFAGGAARRREVLKDSDGPGQTRR